MKTSFLDHPAERQGLIGITGSFKRGEKARSLKDIRHVIIDPHGSLEIPPVRGLEEHLGNYDSTSVERYLKTERDLGIPELREALVASLPNVLAIHYNVNRGLDDPNRHLPFALSTLVKGAPLTVQNVLLSRHFVAERAVDDILSLLSEDVRISLLHSTELYDAPNLRDLDLNCAMDLKALLDQVCGRGLVEFQNSFITGDADGSTHGDRQFRVALERNLREVGKTSSRDFPYVTKLGRYLTSKFMLRFPGRVNAVDWRKDELAEGSGQDGTFALDQSEADPKKIVDIAELFVDAHKRVAHDRLTR